MKSSNDLEELENEDHFTTISNKVWIRNMISTCKMIQFAQLANTV